MDLRIIREHLAEAESHLALSDRHIAWQIQIIDELERDGHPTALALECWPPIAPSTPHTSSTATPSAKSLGSKAGPVGGLFHSRMSLLDGAGASAHAFGAFFGNSQIWGWMPI
jgi:hypothetical protein